MAALYADMVRFVNTALTVVRLSLHVGAATVWVGGQVVVASLVGPLRRAAPDAVAVVARRFARVAWPAFSVLILTGGWNLAVSSNNTSGYQTVLGVKLLLVVLSGVAAYLHTRAGGPRGKAIWGALGLLAALGAMVAGVTLTELG